MVVLNNLASPIFAELGKTKFLYTTNESPYGTPYVQWMQKWWQWIANFTKSNDPNKDYQPAKCHINQNYSGSVWFLTQPAPENTNWERTCDIPKSMAILWPVVSGQCDTSETPSTLDCAKRGDEGAQILVSIDGNRFEYDMVNDRATSDLFNITWVKDNFFDSKPGLFQGNVDGYFIFLKPLPLGKHVVSFESDVHPPNNPEMGFTQKGTYILNVG